MCVYKKKTFETILLVNDRVNEINLENRKSGSTDRLRPYKCEYCGKFHLTSMSKRKYRLNTDVNFRTKVREENFINRESEYYESLYGIS